MDRRRENFSLFQTLPSVHNRSSSFPQSALSYIIIARSLSLSLSLSRRKWSTTKKDFIVRVVMVRGFNASSKREEEKGLQGSFLGSKGLSLSLSLSFFPLFSSFFFFSFSFSFLFPIFFLGKKVPSRISYELSHVYVYIYNAFGWIWGRKRRGACSRGQSSERLFFSILLYI